MFKTGIKCGLALVIFACSLFASNPIITIRRTADPSPKVFNGRVYLYCSHDQDNATNYNSMDNYYVYSSADLVHWTDHGEVLNSSQLINKWAGAGGMWAVDCAYKNNTYYFYFSVTTKNDGSGIGVSKVPQGPFKDTLGKPVMTMEIDPMCFIDDDGQAYLYQGGLTGGDYVAKLNPDMITLAETPKKIDNGTTKNWEGPYMHKRNGIYYFSGSNSGGQYSMGTSPYGPFTYKGKVANPPSGAQDHHAIIEYKGIWYYFYHVGNYTDAKGVAGDTHKRNVCIEYLYYNADGTIKPIVYTTKGVAAVDTTQVTTVLPVNNQVAQSEKSNGLLCYDLSMPLMRFVGNAASVEIFSLQGEKLVSGSFTKNATVRSLLKGKNGAGNGVYFVKFQPKIN